MDMQQGNMPHLYWIDFHGDGVYTECAVMKKDNLGNVYFFPLTSLDKIDKGRLARILTNRNANAFELWDLMSQITLNNGVNALAYFHQLVEMVTPSGKRMKPREGVIGTKGVLDTRGKETRENIAAQMDMVAHAAAKAASEAAANAVRQQHQPAPAAEPQKKAGRPAKTDK